MFVLVRENMEDHTALNIYSSVIVRLTRDPSPGGPTAARWGDRLCQPWKIANTERFAFHASLFCMRRRVKIGLRSLASAGNDLEKSSPDDRLHM